MSYPQHSLFPASPEFISLCQSQVSLLTQGFSAAWSVVYLTKELAEGTQTQLIPVVVYPEEAKVWQQGNSVIIVPKDTANVGQSPKLCAASLPAQLANSVKTPVDDCKPQTQLSQALSPQKQVILPLIHEDVVLGLLMTGREEGEWSVAEISQIEKIVQTLAIACHLDQLQGWYGEQLEQQSSLRERLDDLLHQLRNPLTALRTFSKLLLKRLLGSERDRKVVEGIIRESDRLQDLLEQFDTWLDSWEATIPTLSLDKTARASLPQASSPLLPASATLACQPLAVAEVLEPLLTSAQAMAQEKNITLSADIPPRLPLVQANAQALREVLSNLTDNALKYTPAGGKIHLQAGLERHVPSGWFQGIAISDNGFGIPVQDQGQIFQRRYRGVHSEGSIPGTGLGLAIAQELTGKMSGEIELISPNQTEIPSRGTTFIVWLPVEKT